MQFGSKPLWLVAEQDKTTKGAEVSAQENYTYIAGICGRGSAAYARRGDRTTPC